MRCGVVLLCVVWCGAAWHAENPAVCRFKTPPCVLGKRPHVLDMRAFSGYTRRRLERTHGGVLNLHTEGLSAFSVFLALSLLSVCPSFFLFSSLLFSLSLFPLLSSLSSFSLSNDDKDHSSSRLSLCSHGSNLPECQSACTLAHSLLGEHVRIMQETTVPGITVQASCHLE